MGVLADNKYGLTESEKETLKRQIDFYGKLPQDFKDRWIAALESGEYKKGIGSLYIKALVNNVTEKFYCCLGVAGKICEVPAPQMYTVGLLSDFPKKSKKIYLEENNVPELLYEGITDDLLAHVNDNSEDFSKIVNIIKDFM